MRAGRSVRREDGDLAHGVVGIGAYERRERLLRRFACLE
jgi:hypothetical protein